MDLLSGLFGNFQSIVSYGLPFLFVLTIIVFFHELGHFMVARWCGVAVETFSVGFGREIFGFTDAKGTRWKFSWIPLGGYVKFLGDENAASVPDREGLEQMDAEARETSFYHKSVAKRSAVVAAGPIANFLLAIVIFALIFMIMGRPIASPTVGAIQPDSPAMKAGFQLKDVVVSINGSEVETFAEMMTHIRPSADKNLSFVVRRGEELVTLNVTPVLTAVTDLAGNKLEVGVIGIGQATDPIVDSIAANSAAAEAGMQVKDRVVSIDGAEITSFSDMQQIVVKSAGKPLSIVVRRGEDLVTLQVTPKEHVDTDSEGKTRTVGRLGITRNAQGDIKMERYGPVSAVWLGARETWTVGERTLSYVFGLLAGREKTDQLGGPLRIAQISGQVFQISFAALFNLAAVLSVTIGLINLFPIPMLDGGHLLYYGIEAVRGEPLSERTQDVGFRVGLGLVVALMIFVTWLDLSHFNVF